jgi:hypothetical protein
MVWWGRETVGSDQSRAIPRQASDTMDERNLNGLGQRYRG